jgi:RNA polymerase sigma factor (sigma-70 family)
MDELHIRKVCGGDKEAFRYFIKTYKDMAFSVAMCVIKDEFAAQEIVQDAFVKAFQNLGSFSKKSSFKTWFYRIVTNEALTRLKKSKKEIIDFVGDHEGEVIDEDRILSLKEDEQSFLINESLQRLPPKESLALRLFYLEEESIKEVCGITGWSEANAKIILHRARKNMFIVLTELLKTHSL